MIQPIAGGHWVKLKVDSFLRTMAMLHACVCSAICILTEDR